jgi:RNA recognition motif-containing protein
MIQSRVLLLLLFCNVSDGFLSPLSGRSAASRGIIRLLSSKANGESSPPAFSVVDEYDDDGPGNSSPPSDFTFDDNNAGMDEIEESSQASTTSTPYTPPKQVVAVKKDDDPYSEQDQISATSPRTTRPKRPKRKKIPVQNMAGTSWLDKNDKFSGNEVAPVVEAAAPPTKELLRKPRNTDVGESRERAKQSFRENFRGTRVFVQGIPTGTSWQDLKDHFKIAGDVVFASVSINIETGESKGHGIVQFETTSMAKNAIDIMREHPLHGSFLYVREDVQDNNSNSELRPATKGPTPPTKWKCANEDNIAHMSEDKIFAIRALIRKRDDARRGRNFNVSDRLRDDLKQHHGVHIDDRLKMWWTVVDGNKVPQTIKDIKGDGRWNIESWRQIPTTPENDACVNPDLVEGLLKQRDISRREKDFGTADALLEKARTSPDGDLQLRIHDESRTWRIWTEERPPQQVEHRTPISSDPDEARRDVAKECIEIVKEHAPDKIDEILSVLKNFKGREFQVLKRLRNQYLK